MVDPTVIRQLRVLHAVETETCPIDGNELMIEWSNPLTEDEDILSCPRCGWSCQRWEAAEIRELHLFLVDDEKMCPIDGTELECTSAHERDPSGDRWACKECGWLCSEASLPSWWREDGKKLLPDYAKRTVVVQSWLDGTALEEIRDQYARDTHKCPVCPGDMDYRLWDETRPTEFDELRCTICGWFCFADP